MERAGVLLSPNSSSPPPLSPVQEQGPAVAQTHNWEQEGAHWLCPQSCHADAAAAAAAAAASDWLLADNQEQERRGVEWRPSSDLGSATDTATSATATATASASAWGRSMLSVFMCCCILSCTLFWSFSVEFCFDFCFALFCFVLSRFDSSRLYFGLLCRQLVGCVLCCPLALECLFWLLSASLSFFICVSLAPTVAGQLIIYCTACAKNGRVPWISRNMNAWTLAGDACGTRCRTEATPSHSICWQQQQQTSTATTTATTLVARYVASDLVTLSIQLCSGLHSSIAWPSNSARSHVLCPVPCPVPTSPPSRCSACTNDQQ